MALRAIFCLVLLAGWTQERRPAAAAATQSGALEQHSFRISGTVVDAMGGQPLARTQVTIGAQGVRGASQSTLTGDDGRFVFEKLAPGQYSLFAKRRGYVQQFYEQHEEFSTAIIVGPDLNTENLRFELPPGGSISGQVVDETNEPVRNAQMLLFQRGVALGRRSTWQDSGGQTDDLGHYRFGHLAPGTYFVAVSAQPWYAQRVTHQRRVWRDWNDTVQMSSSSTPFSSASQTPDQAEVEEVTTGEPELDVVYPITFFPNAPDIAGAAAISVRPGNAEIADLRLQPVAALHMIVRVSSTVGEAAASGDAAENENVSAQVLQSLGEEIQMGVPAASQQIAPGVVEISGIPPGRFSLQVNSNKNGESRSHAQSVQLTGDAEVILSESTSLGAVSGIAKLENGSALVPPPTLELRARASGEQFAMQADEKGEFNLRDQVVPPGEYSVLVSQPGAVAVKSMTATGAKVNGRIVEIGGGQDVRLKVVLSEGTGQVTGVALKDGKALDGVMVALVPEQPEHNLVLFRRDQSDSDGSFRLGGVHPGKYTVVAIENGWELEWFTPGVMEKYLAGGETVQVTANAKLEVKVKVQP
jgi:hypothetical protein